MKINISGLGKKYGREWIFKDFDYHFQTGKPVAITGANGSGKSTLLQILSGALPYNKGAIQYLDNQENEIPASEIYKYISFSAPYLELIEEFTLSEFISFHIKFKPFQDSLSVNDFYEKLHFENSIYKPIKFFSSGMKQRLKLGLALFSKSNIILLDEPTATMDQKGVQWYLQNIKETRDNKLLIICSNQTFEYEFCEDIIDIKKFKNF